MHGRIVSIQIQHASKKTHAGWRLSTSVTFLSRTLTLRSAAVSAGSAAALRDFPRAFGFPACCGWPST
ncbi:MAG: hypothetical protein ACRETL_03220, partial [Gammaproteobacteria bacterium]